MAGLESAQAKGRMLRLAIRLPGKGEGSGWSGIATLKTLAVIPAYNEEVAIGSMVLRCQGHVDEVLVVDDGSLDSTGEIARRANAVVIRHARNMGKGVAIQTAFRYARMKGFDAIVLLDGDGQHNPSEIPQVLEPVLRGEADIAYGFRERDGTTMPFHRRLGQRFLDYLTALGSGGVLTDSQCGFRALSRVAIEALNIQENGFAVESEMILEARSKNLRVSEVPVRVRYDVDGSTKGPLSHGIGVVDRLLRIIAMRHPLFFFGLPGAGMVLAGILLGLVTLDSYNRYDDLPILYALLVVLFIVLGSLAIFAGIILNTLPRVVERMAAGDKTGG
jgi:glycosyltransferase involved in cell wall biosynthesis